MPTRFWSDTQRARYGRLPAEKFGLCATLIPNRTFARPYVSTPLLSHARSSNMTKP